MSKKPFEPLTLIADSYDTIKKHIEANEELQEIAIKTSDFLNGFYSDFSLELLSSIDYLTGTKKTFDKEVIIEELEGWSDRKRSMFSNPRYIDISLDHLAKAHKNN